MVDWLVKLVSGGLISEVGKVVDDLVTSDEEREKLKNELIKLQSESELKFIDLANEYGIGFEYQSCLFANLEYPVAYNYSGLFWG